MSIQENAQQLIAHSNEFAQNGLGATRTTSEDLERARQGVARVGELITDSMARANDLLGSGHAGMGGIGAAANAITQQADNVQGAIQQAIGMVLDLEQAVSTYSNTMGQVGHQLLQGGS